MMVYSSWRLKLAAWLFFMAFFIIYMSNADRIYYAVSGKSYVVKLPKSFSLHARGDLQMLWVKDTIPFNNKFEEGKRFIGTFGKVAHTSGPEKVRVFFKSSDALYEIIENYHCLHVESRKAGVDFFAATSRMEPGVYQMGIYFCDTTGEKFAWLNCFFEKVDGGTVEYVARPVTVTPNSVRKNLKFAIEHIDNIDEKKLVRLKGWVVLENAAIDDYTAYITIRDSKNSTKAFYAPLYTRREIASLYDDSRAANCGFQIKIPKDEFVAGNHVLKIMVKSRATGEVLESVQAETRNF